MQNSESSWFGQSLMAKPSGRNDQRVSCPLGAPRIERKNSDDTISDSEEDIPYKKPMKRRVTIDELKIPDFFNNPVQKENTKNNLALYEDYMKMFNDQEDFDLYCVPKHKFMS